MQKRLAADELCLGGRCSLHTRCASIMLCKPYGSAADWQLRCQVTLPMEGVTRDRDGRDRLHPVGRRRPGSAAASVRAKFGPMLVALVLAGCTSDRFDDTVAGYKGGPVEALIARWGEPERVSVTPNSWAHVYTWSGARRDGATATTVRACTVKVLVDRLDRITAFGFHGDDVACEAYADRLRDP